MNQLTMLLFISCFPVILMIMYINGKDKDKEPKYLLQKIFFYGILSIFPILVLEIFAKEFISVDKGINPLNLFINIFISIALIEEGAKWVIINKAIYYEKDFNHPYDAIIYSAFASLGFALIENIIYVLGNGAVIGIFRGISAIPCHTCDGIIMGYFLGKARSEEYKNNTKLSKKYMLYSLLFPVVVHTFYDFSILLQNKYTLILLPFSICFIFIVGFILVKKVSIIDYNFDGNHYSEKLSYQIDSNGFSFKYALKMMFVLSVCLILISGITLVHF